MDENLKKRLGRIEDQIEVLKSIESKLFNLRAHEHVIFAKIYLGVLKGSVEDRKNSVYASQDWIDFSKGLAEAEVQFLEEKRRYELKLKAFDAEYLTLKTENQAIVRQR